MQQALDTAEVARAAAESKLKAAIAEAAEAAGQWGLFVVCCCCLQVIMLPATLQSMQSC